MKKFLSLVLVFAMLCSLIVINVSAAKVDTWNGSASTSLEGSGTKDDPYQINSAADLKYFADLSNAGDNFTGKYITQTVDIDLNNITWTPIAYTDNNAFGGVYDGQGHTISNMKIDQNLAGGYCLGLFGYVGKAGSADPKADCGIANLTLTGAITVGKDRVGGLVGQINNRNHTDDTYKVYITNVTCDVDVTIENYTSTGKDNDAKHYWGGVAGIANVAVFENVVNNGTIKATNCHAENPVGGIAGRAAMTTFISCVNNGTVTANTTNTSGMLRAGGIVGIYIKNNAAEYLTFVNCVNNAAVSAVQASSGDRVHAGGILGSVRYNTAKLAYATNESYDETINTGYGKNVEFGKTYAKYDLSVYGCVNTANGVITATNAGTKETNAAGIVGTLNHGYNSADNNAGNIKIHNCVNLGNVTANTVSGDERAAGIAGALYTRGGYTFGTEIFSCYTAADLGTGSVIVNFVENGMPIPKTSIVQNGAESFANAAAVAAEYSKTVPSTFDINGFNTGVDVSVWNGGSSAFLFGSGTATDPYLIRNANDLKGLANMVNGTVKDADNYGNPDGYNINGVNTFDGKYFKQTADINLNNIEWLPIGFRETAVFQGVYDGDGHSVTNLKITTISYRTGLFGGVGYVKSHTASHTNVAPTGESGIANLNVSGNVTLTTTTGHATRFYAGGVVSFLGDDQLTDGEYKSYLINVSSAVNVTAKGFGGGAAFGGVVGHAYNAVLENVTNSGAVTVAETVHAKVPAGGIVGFAKSCDLTGCVNTAAVSVTISDNKDKTLAGGIVGRYDKHNVANYLNLTNCVNLGAVTATSTNASPGYVGAGGMLGGFWYNAEGTGTGNDGATGRYAHTYTYLDTGRYWSDLKVTFVNCVNSGVVSAYATGEGVTASTGAVQAGGILSSTYAGSNKLDNNGGFLFDNCVNMADINCTNPDRSAGITGTVWTDAKYAYGIKFIHCLTSASVNAKGQLVKPGTFGVGEKDTVYLTATGELSATDDPYANSPGSSRADALANWIKNSLVAPSTTNINNMPTAAKVAVLTGVKNLVEQLPYAVPETMVVVDANGDKVTNITAPGVYTVKVALVQVTPYVADMFALDYTIAYEKDYLSDTAEFGFGFGELTNWASATAFAEDFNKFSTYGKLTAAVSNGTFNSILPQQVGKTVSMAVVDDGVNVITKDYSLETYALNQLGKTAEALGITDEKKQALDHFLVAMLKYVAVAQGLKGETTDLATDKLSPAQLTFGGTFTTDGLTNVKSVGAAVENELFKWASAALVFDTNITVRFKFVTEENPDNYVIKVTVNGNEYLDYNVDYENGYIELFGFAPTMYDDVITVHIETEAANAVSKTVTYSVNSYIVNMYEDATYGDLVKALACYAASANKYLAIEA